MPQEPEQFAAKVGPYNVAVCHFPYTGDSHGEDRYVDARPVDQGRWLIHGHVHEAWKVRGRQVNVGVDVWFVCAGERRRGRGSHRTKLLKLVYMVREVWYCRPYQRRTKGDQGDQMTIAVEDLTVLASLERELPGVVAWAEDTPNEHLADEEGAVVVTAAERVAEYVEVLNRKEIARAGGARPYAKFYLDRPGRKFTRVVMDTSVGANERYGQSVHAFVDAEGHVFMPAGWRRPAADARFDLMDDDSRYACFARAEFAGGYLYKR